MPSDPDPRDLSNFEFTFNSPLSSSGTAALDDLIDTQSISTSVREPQEENGRTYHGYHAHSYHFPNDPREQERLDYQHRIIKTVMDNRLYLAPWSRRNSPRRVLDVATGTGKWAIELGDEFPGSLVVGTDLSPIQPDEAPPNVHFFVEDSRCEWLFGEPFDYVHARMTAGAWEDMREEVVRRAFENLRPGGWLEAQEVDPRPVCDDGSMDEEGDAFCRWERDLEAASEAAGRPITVAPRLREWFAEEGFVEVQETRFMLPINGWPADERLKRIGRWWQENLIDGISGFTLALHHRFRGKTAAQIEVDLMDARRAIRDERVHAYHTLHVVWGRKPGPAVSPYGLSIS
ncbi:S-adenosyl-L-methionine-dependent methyltransferase [Pleurostoma richardsiae]|uniref:S-adenosyl-L-methionine-dependent methyltransferase n=1 Tax=Pleurostoma richardsiae TaxID=41990 RepID=A0AA38VGK1_9PEZI|nr:S-adenosyl-L-methionine-dependent methyltransferase [Pleurostoma richardsiae]